jgi:hypothetical protein
MSNESRVAPELKYAQGLFYVKGGNPESKEVNQSWLENSGYIFHPGS